MKKAKPTEPTPYNIEHGVEIPPIVRRGCIKDTLAVMEPGDSIVVETRKATGWRVAAKRRGVAIATRREGDNTRVWLTK